MDKLQNKDTARHLAKRIFAYGLDVAAITMLYSFFTYYFINQKLGVETIVQNQLSLSDRTKYSVIALVCGLFWMVAVPVFNRGKTFGKSLMHIEMLEDGQSVSTWKIIVRQLCFLFLLGGFLNPCYGYLIDLLVIHVNSSLQYLQTIANGFSVFCICSFLFTKSHRTYYDKILHVRVCNIGGKL